MQTAPVSAETGSRSMSDPRAVRDRLLSSLSIAVAIGVLADVYLPVGRAGVCVRSATGLLWPLLAALGLTVIIARSLRGIDVRHTATVALLGFATIWLTGLMILNLVPPIARDELTHHLAMPALYVRAGRVLEVPFAEHAYYPMLLEMLYTPLVARGWENAAKYLHLEFGVAACALLLEYLRPRCRPWLAMASAVLLLSTPTVSVLGASAYVDLGLLFYSVVALIALLRWSETDQLAYFVVSGLGAGCAASTKYNGLLLIMLLALLVLLLARERGAVSAIGLAVAFGVLSLVPLLPWLLKNAAETGNPLFPLFNGVLGGRLLPAAPAIDVLTTRRILYGESWIEIALVPIRVFVTGREGDPARFDGVFNPLYLLAFAAVIRRGAPSRERWLAGVAAVLLLSVFFLHTFRSRYAISVLVPLAVVVAEMLERGAARWRSAVMAVAVGALLFNGAHFVHFWTSVDPLAFVSGRESRGQFITRFVPEYPVVEYANASLPADANVDLEFLGSRGYYWARAYRYDTSLPGVALRDAIRQAANGDEVAARLRSAGVSHLACADGLLLRFLRDNLSAIEYKCWEDFGREHLRLIYDHQGFGLYEIG